MVQRGGRTDVFHTNKGDRDHGHVVVKNKSLEYARTQSGRVKENRSYSKEYSSGSSTTKGGGGGGKRPGPGGTGGVNSQSDSEKKALSDCLYGTGIISGCTGKVTSVTHGCVLEVSTFNSFKRKKVASVIQECTQSITDDQLKCSRKNNGGSCTVSKLTCKKEYVKKCGEHQHWLPRLFRK